MLVETLITSEFERKRKFFERNWKIFERNWKSFERILNNRLNIFMEDNDLADIEKKTSQQTEKQPHPRSDWK